MLEKYIRNVVIGVVICIGGCKWEWNVGLGGDLFNDVFLFMIFC